METSYNFDTSSFSSGDYTVGVAVVLGDQESASSSAGDVTMAIDTITITGEN